MAGKVFSFPSVTIIQKNKNRKSDMKIVFCKYSSKDDDFLSSEIDAVFQEEGDRLKRGNLKIESN